MTNQEYKRGRTDEQVLEEAIQKAIEGGWKPLKSMVGNRVVVQQWQKDGMVEVGIINDAKPEDVLTWVRELEGIIFNHEFCKALWGEGYAPYIVRVIKPNGNLLSGEDLPLWKVHLQQMVITDDPIDYLSKNI